MSPGRTDSIPRVPVATEVMAGRPAGKHFLFCFRGWGWDDGRTICPTTRASSAHSNNSEVVSCHETQGRLLLVDV